MTEVKKVKIEVTSQEGHTEFSLTPKEAIEKIKKIHESDGKWCYLDGTNVSPSRLTESDVTEANTIRMMDVVVGGENAAIIDVHVTPFVDENGNSVVESIDEDSCFPVTFEFIPPNAEKMITDARIRLWIDESKFTEVAHLRDFFFKGTLAKLNELLQNEHDKFMETYNL